MDRCVLFTSTPSCVVSLRGDHSGCALAIARRGETTHSYTHNRMSHATYKGDLITFFAAFDPCCVIHSLSLPMSMPLVAGQWCMVHWEWLGKLADLYTMVSQQYYSNKWREDAHLLILFFAIFTDNGKQSWHQFWCLLMKVRVFFEGIISKYSTNVSWNNINCTDRCLQ